MRFRTLETGAEYFFRELPDGTVAWVGESLTVPGMPKAAANIFVGRRTGPAEVRGDMIDVPKGRASGIFRDLRVTTGATGMHFDLPGIGRRTLAAPDTDLPHTNAREWGCGFYDEAPESSSFSLTGVWSCNDGGTYYVRQFGNQVVWLGEHANGHWANVFMGEITGDEVAGRWIDVPKGRAMGSGAIRLRVAGVAPLAMQYPGTRLERISATGGFGGSEWHKTDTVRLAFRLRRIDIVSNADVGGLNRGGDEPYLMPLYITIGGNQYTEPSQLIDRNARARPAVVSPLFQHEWGTRGDWPKNNITWQEDLVPGTSRPIPEYITYWETELRTLRGLQPNSRAARETALFLPGIFAMEEASTRNEDVRAFYNALLAHAPDAIHAGIQDSALSLSLPDIQNLVNRLKQAVVAAVTQSVTSDLFGLLGLADPDKTMGADFTGHSLGAMRDAALSGSAFRPIIMTFRGGAGGVWRVSGTISSSLGPASFSSGQISQLEVALETGGDNKEPGSRVELNIGLRGGSVRGPYSAHAEGHPFPSGTLHTAIVPVNPPVSLGTLEVLRIGWTRQPGDNLLRQPDSWDLKAVRVVAFDPANRRFVLRRAHPANLKLEQNGSVSISLRGG